MSTPDSTSARAPNKDIVCGYCHHPMSQHGAGSGCLAYQCDCPTVSLVAPATPPGDETPRPDEPFGLTLVVSMLREIHALASAKLPSYEDLQRERMTDIRNDAERALEALAVPVIPSDKTPDAPAPRAPLVDTGGPTADGNGPCERCQKPRERGNVTWNGQVVCDACQSTDTRDYAPPSPEGTGTPPSATCGYCLSAIRSRDSGPEFGYDHLHVGCRAEIAAAKRAVAGEIPGVGAADIEGDLWSFARQCIQLGADMQLSRTPSLDFEMWSALLDARARDAALKSPNARRVAALRVRAEAAERDAAILQRNRADGDALLREFSTWASHRWPHHAGLDVFEATKREIATLEARIAAALSSQRTL